MTILETTVVSNRTDVELHYIIETSVALKHKHNLYVKVIAWRAESWMQARSIESIASFFFNSVMCFTDSLVTAGMKFRYAHLM